MRVLIPASQIQQRIEELARKISADYSGGSVLLVGILKGACIFLADLVRALTIPARIDFVGVSSYGGGTVTSNEVKLTKDIDLCIEGLDVLIVEDIVDSGVTLTYLCDLLRNAGQNPFASSRCLRSRSGGAGLWRSTISVLRFQINSWLVSDWTMPRIIEICGISAFWSNNAGRRDAACP